MEREPEGNDGVSLGDGGTHSNKVVAFFNLFGESLDLLCDRKKVRAIHPLTPAEWGRLPSALPFKRADFSIGMVHL